MHIGFHRIAELQVRVIIGRRAVEDRIFRVASELFPARQFQYKMSVRESTFFGKQMASFFARDALSDHDLFLRHYFAGSKVLSAHDDREISLYSLRLGYYNNRLLKRSGVGRDHGHAAVVPGKCQLIAAALRKSCCVEHLESASRYMSDPDRAIDESDDLRAGGRSPVGIEKAVHTEIAVVAPLAVVSSVGVAAVLVENRVIDHLPHAAADQVVVFIDLFPVGFGIAGSHSHGVRVFAHEIGPVVELLLLAAVLAGVMDHLYGRVHLAADIISDPLAVDGALVVYGQIRAKLQVVVHRVCIVIAARLISEAPHHDRCVAVDLISLVETADPVDIVRLPFAVMADGIVGRGKLHRKCPVGLQVVLVHDIETVFVSEL